VLLLDPPAAHSAVAWIDLGGMELLDQNESAVLTALAEHQKLDRYGLTPAHPCFQSYREIIPGSGVSTLAPVAHPISVPLVLRVILWACVASAPLLAFIAEGVAQSASSPVRSRGPMQPVPGSAADTFIDLPGEAPQTRCTYRSSTRRRDPATPPRSGLTGFREMAPGLQRAGRRHRHPVEAASCTRFGPRIGASGFDLACRSEGDR
jgi:hypothetical protein